MKRTLSVAAILSALILSNAAFSAGALHLQGKLKSKTPEVIEVSDGRHVFVIKSSELPAAQQDRLKTMKLGDAFDADVPFESIKDAKPVPSKKQ